MAIGVIAIVAVAVGAFFGLRFLQSTSRFVSTDKAQVAAPLVKVSSFNAGRIINMNADVGTSVVKGQIIAMVDIPAVISRSDTTGTAKLGLRDVQDQQVPVLAPASGVVVARWAEVGDDVAAGQTVVTLMDLKKVWVVANIDERKIGPVQPGQYAEVYVRTLGRTLRGRVESVSPVTAAIFDPPPPRRTTAQQPTVFQQVPVKIILEDGHLPLIPGSSVKVKIQVAD